jgi:hypothetical protein
VDGVERVLRVNGGKEYLVQYRGIVAMLLVEEWFMQEIE